MDKLADRIAFSFAPATITGVGGDRPKCATCAWTRFTGAVWSRRPKSARRIFSGDGGRRDVRLQMTGVWEAYSGSPTAGMMVLPGMAPYLAPEVSAGAMPKKRSIGCLCRLALSGHELIVEVSRTVRRNGGFDRHSQHSTAPTPGVRSANMATPSDCWMRLSKRHCRRTLPLGTASANEMLVGPEDVAEMPYDLTLFDLAAKGGYGPGWPATYAGRRPRLVRNRWRPRMSATRRDPRSLETNRAKTKSARSGMCRFG